MSEPVPDPAAGSSARRSFVTPYETLERARKARPRMYWGLGVAVLGIAVAGVSVIVSALASASVSAGSSSYGGSRGAGAAFVGPLIVLALAASFRRQLDRAAGRRLTRDEVYLIGDSTSAGILVPDDDLVIVQEVFARKQASVRFAWAISVFLTLAVLVIPFSLLAIGALPVPLAAVSAILCALGVGYASWGMLRRAAGGEAVNDLFNASLSEDEEDLLDEA